MFHDKKTYPFIVSLVILKQCPIYPDGSTPATNAYYLQIGKTRTGLNIQCIR